MISIVTINFNNAVGLKRTIESVAAQTYHKYEHIIVDGNSTNDDSLKLIQEYDYKQRSAHTQTGSTPTVRWI